MPAHQSKSAIGNRCKSDGRRINCIDYKANRLVDKLATHGYERNKRVEEGQKLIKAIKTAAKVALATLGQVTWCANNCSMTIVKDNGEEVIKICRDSIDKPVSAKKTSSADQKGTAGTKKEAKEEL